MMRGGIAEKLSGLKKQKPYSNDSPPRVNATGKPYMISKKTLKKRISAKYSIRPFLFFVMARFRIAPQPGLQVFDQFGYCLQKQEQQADADCKFNGVKSR
jgi:hypothetical protein